MDMLWADDDNSRLLSPLGRVLQKKGGFSVHRKGTYVDACQLLLKHHRQNTPFASVLLDVVLPEAERDGGIASNLGFRLGADAIAAGARAVVFLTVVPIGTVQEEFDQLRNQAKGARVEYFDKTELLEVNRIQSLVESLTPRAQ